MERNCFDATRHIAALLVLYSHHYALSGMKEPMFFNFDSLGGLALVIFFSISGYLVISSYIRSKNIISYVRNRLLRIYPALILCLVIMALIICPLLGKGNAIDYIFSENPFNLISRGIRLYKYNGSGVTANDFGYDYIRPNVINGSLWTLHIEFVNYILVIFVLFSKNDTIKKLSVFFMICVVFYLVTRETGSRESVIANYSIPFAAGALAGFLIEKQEKTKYYFIIIGSSIIVLMYLFGHQGIIHRLTYFSILPFVIIGLCLTMNDIFIKRRFDLSYGIYIYSFPTQQIVINEFDFSFYQSMFVSFLVVILLSFFSWHFVEKVFLMKKIIKKENYELNNNFR
ncbi:acyltransferase [Pectobacterium sp. HCp5_1]|uniref:acyltransferase family protein n=1 Tax=Pectobacterium sp. HCp5_1 TaxID=3062446 RepID=UPI00293BD3D7|nr:acyltransferase [Pectobacterium sp. HCp5_1]